MTPELAASHQFCQELSRQQAKYFYYSFLLLPPERRRAMQALYAFMRRTDDIADEPGEAAEKTIALDAWRNDLDLALTGQKVSWPGMAALADTVHQHTINPKHLHDVIDGVAMDLTPRVFETFDDLYPYCYRVASAVGLCCISIWGYQSRDGQAERMAEQCGVALQLTNILRDVAEDARNGRVYLPQDELRRFGVTAEDFSGNQLTPALKELFAFQAERAYRYYAQAAPLIRLVDPVGRPVLGAIMGIYRGLLDEIVKREYNVLAERVSLPGWKKAWIALAAFPSRLGRAEAKLAEHAS